MKYLILAILLMEIAACPVIRADDIYVFCMSNNSVVKMTDGTLSTFASGKGRFTGLAVDSFGNLYLSDESANSILKYEMHNRTLSKTPIVFASGLNKPQDLAFDHEGNLYETDLADHINKFVYSRGHLSNQPSVFADGSPEHGSLTGSRAPSYLAFDRKGDLYVSMSVDGILRFTRTASGLSNLPDTTPFATVNRVRQLAFDKQGNLFAASHQPGEFYVYKFPLLATGLSGTPNIFASGNGLDAPHGVAFDSEGNLYVTNWGYGRGTTVLKYPSENGILSNLPVIWGASFACPVLIWCEKSPPQAAPKVDHPEKVQPPPNPLTQHEKFYGYD